MNFEAKVLKITRANGDIRFIAVIDTYEYQKFLWFKPQKVCTNREYLIINSRAKTFFGIRRIDEDFPKNSVLFDTYEAAERQAFEVVHERQKNQEFEFNTRVIKKEYL